MRMPTRSSIVNRSPCAHALVLLLAGLAQVQAAPGDVDPTFVYQRPAAEPSESTNAVPLPNGYLVVRSRMGGATASDSTLALTLIDLDGRVIDYGFGTDGTYTNTVPGAVDLALATSRAANGKVLLGGYKLKSGSTTDSTAAIARVDGTGQLDPSFGQAGVATIDAPGERDRVAAVAVMPDGRIAALVWSMYPNPYDCATDQARLYFLQPDGTDARAGVTAYRDRYTATSCRTSATLHVDADGTVLIGTELGVLYGDGVGAGASLLPGSWGYGPFAMDAQLGLVGTTIAGQGVNVFVGERPSWSSDNDGLVEAAGYSAPATWSKLVVDAARSVVYVAFATDDGQVGVARFKADGTLDTGWGGGRGVVAIAGSGSVRTPENWVSQGLATEARLLQVDAAGNLLVVTADGIMQRLAGGSAPSPGAFVLVHPLGSVSETSVSVPVTVRRVGGSTGAASVTVTAVACDSAPGRECPYAKAAQPGEDFRVSSQRLDWADGDATDRTVYVQLVDDNLAEAEEMFLVEISEVTDGFGVLTRRVPIVIISNEKPDPSPTTNGPEHRSRGGSGQTGLITLLLLVATALASMRARARGKHRALASLLASIALAVTAPATWAGIGDMDPSFGDSGVMRFNRLLPALRDGRLLYLTKDGFGRTDIDGRRDTTFGSNGERDWPAGFRPGTTYFYFGGVPATWSQTPDARTLIAGTVPVPAGSGRGLAVLGLRPDGEVDGGFGTDGLVSLPTLRPATAQSNQPIMQELVLDRDGRILVLTMVLFDYYDFIATAEVARLRPDGTPDRTFGAGGVVDIYVGGDVEDLVIDALRDGRIRIGGVYLTETGTHDPGTPVVDADLGPVARHWILGATTADGGRLMTAANEAAGASSYLVAHLKADGSLDRHFGQSATGVLTLSSPLAGWDISRPDVSSPDGRYLLVAVAAGPYRYGIARYRATDPGAGGLDPDFGDGGVVDLGRLDWIGHIAGTVDGGVVVDAGTGTLRLLGAERPGPGFASLASDQQTWWREDKSPMVVRMSRRAGSDGTLRIRYSTSVPVASAYEQPAQAGVDFEAVSGELVWGDGDTADKSFPIPLLTDATVEGYEELVVEMKSLTPGGWVAREAVHLAIQDPPAATPAPVPSPTVSPPEPGRSGGGGATDAATICILVMAIAAYRFRRGHRPLDACGYRS